MTFPFCTCARGQEAKRWADAGLVALPALLSLYPDLPCCSEDGLALVVETEQGTMDLRATKGVEVRIYPRSA